MTKRYGPSELEVVAHGHERGTDVAEDSPASSGAHCAAKAQDTAGPAGAPGRPEGADDAIRRYLREHVAHALHFPALADVIFEVKDGRVTLSGTVPHRVMKQSIEDTAAACPGVRHVENNLDVALTAPWPDAQALRSGDSTVPLIDACDTVADRGVLKQT